MNMEGNKDYKMDPFSDIPKKGDFKVPSGYFDQLTEDIMDRLEGEVEAVNKRKWRTILYYSAGIAAVLIIGLFIMNAQETKECKTFACLLEKTEITSEDIQWLEEEVEMDLLFDEEDEDVLF